MRQDLWPVDVAAPRPMRRHSHWSELRFNSMMIALASISVGALVAFLYGVLWLAAQGWAFVSGFFA